MVRLLVILLAIFAPTALAAACGCTTIPSEGAYNSVPPALITIESGTNDDCPTRIHLVVDGGSDGSLDMDLDCQGDNTWFGIHLIPQIGGGIAVRIRAIPADTSNLAEDLRAPAAAGLQMGTTIQAEVFPPLALQAIGKRKREAMFTLKGSLSGPSIPAACICGKVEEELKFIKAMRDTNRNPALLAFAQANAVPGNDANSRFWMDDNRQLHKGGPYDDSKTFESYVSDIAEGNLVMQGGLPVESPPTMENDGTLPQSQPPNVALAEADTSEPCGITVASTDVVTEECLPRIVVEAAFLYEQQHQKLCFKNNRPAEWTLPNGDASSWLVDGRSEAGLRIGNLPVVGPGYVAWSLNPENQGKDEGDAYAAEAEMLEKWLAANCQSVGVTATSTGN